MEVLREFLNRLASKGIRLEAIDGQLSCYAPKGTLTADMKEGIAKHKFEIVAYLQGTKDGLRSPHSDRMADGTPREFPLTVGEKGLYILQKLQPAMSAYNVPLCFKIHGELDVPLLVRAWELVLEQYPILTARIIEKDGELCHLLEDGCKTSVRTEAIDIENEEELIAVLRRRVKAPFDLNEGPLTRAELFVRDKHEPVLLLTIHHIIFDGTSGMILLKTFLAFYQQMVRGKEVQASQDTSGYHEFVAWEKAMLASTEGHSHAEYWERQLSGDLAILKVLPDFSPQDASATEGKTLVVDLPSELGQWAREFGKAHSLSTSVIFLATFQLLLHKYTGQDDVIVGMPVMGRSSQEFSAQVGYFINMVPLRTHCDDQLSVLEFFWQVGGTMLDALYHSSYPFPLMLEKLTFSTMGKHPVFQVIYAYQNFMDEGGFKPLLQGLLFENVEGVVQEGGFDLALEVYERPTNFQLYVKYNSNAYTEDTAQRFAANYFALLKGISQNPTLPLWRYSTMDDLTRQRILVEWNDTRTDFPTDQCVHELFEEQVRQSPDATAVVFEADSLSYRELNRRSNQLAYYLRQLGAGPDTRVAIFAERSVELIVALLAVLKSGSAYLPLDPAYPPERLKFMLDEGAPVAVLAQVQLESVLGELVGKLPVVDVADSAFAWKDQPARNLQKAALGLNSRHLAYVIYTSGSTGTPKGIMVEHQSVVNRLLWMQAAYGLQPGECVLQKTPFSFDVSVWEFFWPLLTGGSLVIARPEGHKDAAYLTELIQQRHVTTAHFVPSMLQAFLGYSQVGRASTLVRVVCSGEALSSALVKRFHDCFPGATLHNLYGPTEAAVDVTAWTCPSDFSGTSVPIGKPIANTQAYILDTHGEPVPVGVTGELYIGGVQVARGYLNRPELTAERFLHNPFVEEPGARMYRTGDLVRWLPDGNIEYLGRNDFQVKMRGFRIELGEIETRLAEHPAVHQAVVISREDTAGDKRLVAYYTVKASQPVADEHIGPTVITEQLLSHLSASLPEYMVPAAYVRLPVMPLTSSGKLDRKALPAPDTDAFSTHSYEAPQGETETKMAAIWAELLKVDRVGRDDDFFSLGGHSLLALTLIERMRQSGFTLDMRSLFAAPTLAQLAATLQSGAPPVEVPSYCLPLGSEKITPEMLPLVNLSQGEIDEIVSTVPGGIANVQDIYPLAPLQEGILFHHLMSAEGDPYLVASLFSFDTRERLDAYLNALQEVVQRHDILRTAVLWEGLVEPVQVVWREAKVPLEEIAFDSEAGDVLEQLYARFDPRRYRIDVRRAPLLRIVTCYDAANQRSLMMLLVHHLMDDNTSMRIMASEIKAHLLGQQSDLPTPLPFRNLVAQARLGISQQEHEGFFRRMLEDVDEPTLPFGLADVNGDGTGIEEAQSRLERGLSHRLREQARRLRVSAAALCHLAWAQVLASVSGREDVVFGTVLFGRMQGGEGGDYGIGMFINTLPVRIRVNDENVEAAVRRTHSLLTDLMRHEHASLALAQRCSAVPVMAPLFSALLNYRHVAGARQTGMEETVEALEGIQRLRGEERTNYPLMLSVDDLDEDIELTAQTLTSVGAKRVCQYMLTALESLVKTLETTPSTATRDLVLLPEGERRQLLYEFNNNHATYPQCRCIHDLFREQVVSHGEETAVVCGQERLTYQQLLDRSRDLALYLQSRGVGRDHLIGVCMERSLDMVVSLLGILQAGGAYVPLDPEYPQERIAYMLQDSGAVMVLTQEKLRNKVEALLTADTRLVALDQQRSEIEDCLAGLKANQVALRQQAQANDLAYVIYTSGSTGKPKGVAIEHHSPVTLIYWARDVYRPEEWAGVLAATSICFDLSVFEIFGTLCNGGKVILVPNALGLMNLADKESVTLINTVPSAMEELVRMDAVPKSVQTVNLAGEPLSTALVDRVYEHTSAKRVYDLYGPSESTTYSTYILREPHASANIGRPVANTQVYILDSQRNLQPIGVAGELHIAGDGLARGYLNRPELTQEKFVANPFHAGARMYKTGDLARWQPDGRLEYLGRIDTQVKIRGFRIETGEIEARLKEYDGIMDTAVVAQGQQGDKKLVAFYRAKETTAENIAQLPTEELRAHLLKTLPEYMLPTAYASLVAIPLSPNGKVDRRALERIDVATASSQKYVAPHNDVERQLVDIWAQLLDLPAERIGINDNFFELGGHSLVAVQLIAKMNRQFEHLLPVESIFSATTIAALSRLVSGDQEASMDILVPIQVSGDMLPIFGVPAAGGSVLPLQPISRSLGVNQPFYGLQAIGLDGKTPPKTSVEDTATVNIAAMKKAQPHGPYRLLGVSYGGIVAFEMAKQLLEKGEDVDSLTLLDSMPPSVMNKVIPENTDTDFFFFEAIAHLYDGRVHIDIERLRHNSNKENVEYMTRLMHDAGLEVNTFQFAALHSVYKANMACSRIYDPARLSRKVQVSLYRARTPEHGPALSRDYDWSHLLQNPVQIYDVDATHATIVEHVRLAF